MLPIFVVAKMQIACVMCVTLTLCSAKSKVAIITSQRDTYVEFLYPSSGLNWLQGDVGESGLPDIRPQSGFVAEDGRFYTLPGSGSDSVGFQS